MRSRLWYELAQAKYNEEYTCNLIGYQWNILNFFNLVITIFSTTGIMGWKFWNNLPALACAIIALISIAKLVQPHLLPSDKQIEKLDKVSDFYYDFYLKLEKLWFDSENDRINDTELLHEFQKLKQTEREINRIVNEIHKSTNKKLAKKSQIECDNFFQRAFYTV